MFSKPSRFQRIAIGAYRQRSQSSAAVISFEDAKPFQDIPRPKGLPLLNNALNWTQNENNFVEYHRSLIKELGDVYKFRMPGRTEDIVFINDTDHIRKLFANDGATPHIAGFQVLEEVRKGPLQHLFQTPGLASNGKEWQDFRQSVQQDMMRPKSALFYIEELSELMDEVMTKLMSSQNDNGEVLNISSTMKEYGLEAIGRMFLGARLGVLQGSAEGQKLIGVVQRFFALFTITAMIPPGLLKYTPQYKEFVECQRVMFTISMKNIKKSIAKHEVDGSLDGTILGKLINKCGKDSNVPAIMALDAIGAGIDTTGNAGAILLHHLASNPQKQEKLYEEIKTVIGDGGDMSEDKLAEMRYLKACIQESMRLKSIIDVSNRQTNVDMVLGGFQVPKGSYVIRHNAVTSNSEKYFTNPELFEPERWIRGCPGFEKADPFASLTFGFGPRSCVGQRFAKLELYMVAFKIVHKYKLAYNGPPLHISYAGVGHPDKDVIIQFEDRK